MDGSYVRLFRYKISSSNFDLRLQILELKIEIPLNDFKSLSNYMSLTYLEAARQKLPLSSLKFNEPTPSKRSKKLGSLSLSII